MNPKLPQKNIALGGSRSPGGAPNRGGLGGSTKPSRPTPKAKSASPPAPAPAPAPATRSAVPKTRSVGSDEPRTRQVVLTPGDDEMSVDEVLAEVRTMAASGWKLIEYQVTGHTATLEFRLIR